MFLCQRYKIRCCKSKTSLRDFYKNCLLNLRNCEVYWLYGLVPDIVARTDNGFWKKLAQLPIVPLQPPYTL